MRKFKTLITRHRSSSLDVFQGSHSWSKILMCIILRNWVWVSSPRKIKSCMDSIWYNHLLLQVPWKWEIRFSSQDNKNFLYRQNKDKYCLTRRIYWTRCNKQTRYWQNQLINDHVQADRDLCPVFLIKAEAEEPKTTL